MPKFSRFFLMSALCLGLAAPAMAQDELSQAQQESVNSMIEDYIQNNPDVIMDALEQYRQDQVAQAELDQKEALSGSMDYFNQDSLPTAGAEDGDIRVVEFFDYNCGYCKRALQDVQLMLEADEDVEFVMVDMPILGPSSLTAAKWALAAKEQDKYFEYHQALMAHSGQKSEQVLSSLAENIGLDVEQLRQDAQSQEINTQIQNNLQLAREVGISGTPAFIIGEELYKGYIGYDGMKAIVKEERDAAS